VVEPLRLATVPSVPAITQDAPVLAGVVVPLQFPQAGDRARSAHDGDGVEGEVLALPSLNSHDAGKAPGERLELST